MHAAQNNHKSDQKKKKEKKKEAPDSSRNRTQSIKLLKKGVEKRRHTLFCEPATHLRSDQVQTTRSREERRESDDTLHGSDAARFFR